jgi:glycosyltransferase involved in cell wall biosynthesis
VGVVVPTRARPQQLRAALESILNQDYRGHVEIVVVFDATDPDAAIEGARVRATANTRSAGLAGARNTGILALDSELVAFCDDDDVWLPGKLAAQAARLMAAPDADFASCSVIVEYAGRATVRTAGSELITHARLLRSRMAMMHSSTFLIRRSRLLTRIGLVDEAIPGSQGEDWDLLLRASRAHPIVHVDRPLVRVLWSEGSYYERDWESKVRSLEWMLARHPDIAADRAGCARVFGQLAFAHAAMGARADALSWSRRALARFPFEPRALLAAATALGLTKSDAVLHLLHLRGRGI